MVDGRKRILPICPNCRGRTYALRSYVTSSKEKYDYSHRSFGVTLKEWRYCPNCDRPVRAVDPFKLIDVVEKIGMGWPIK